MLPKPKRLTKDDFKGIKPRIIFRGSFVDVAALYTPNTTLSRFSCVIAKKRIKKAVERNRIKRKVYHALKMYIPEKNYIVVIYPKITILSTSYTQISNEIKLAFATL
ncbi:MAG: ribonuclease P protein component [Candidatus Pacebacteria bacterium]|nr:ribonuclease P protein component [Candidatus Paceibacterota bacterium]MBP9866690.1 ribonuclease P protein component [Candidatus Paceibacterota bacterium]